MGEKLEEADWPDNTVEPYGYFHPFLFSTHGQGLQISRASVDTTIGKERMEAFAVVFHRHHDHKPNRKDNEQGPWSIGCAMSTQNHIHFWHK